MMMEVCRHADGVHWIWRILSRNGRFVAQCPKPYIRKKACVDIATRIAQGCDHVSVES